MKFNATEKQVKQIAVNAVNASKPMGYGHLHFREVEYEPDDIEFANGRNIEIDYFEGRMVKLYIRKNRDGFWEFTREPHIDYQSWKRKYPTNEALVNSVLGS